MIDYLFGDPVMVSRVEMWVSIAVVSAMLVTAFIAWLNSDDGDDDDDEFGTYAGYGY